jgi:MarR family transcriptional regulator, organic hydroperoxide resistance regulator
MAMRAAPRLSGEILTYALVDSIFKLSSANQAQVSDLMAELDITTALANALWKLEPAQQAPSMRDLGMMLRCDPSTVTFLADRLHERGLITREVDESNRRVKRIVLTTKGRKVRTRLTEAMTTRSPIARLSEDEQRQLHALIHKALAQETTGT